MVITTGNAPKALWPGVGGLKKPAKPKPVKKVKATRKKDRNHGR